MTLMLWLSAFNFGKQYRFYELPPEKRGNAFVDYFQASLNYGPQVAYWPNSNIEITSILILINKYDEK